MGRARARAAVWVAVCVLMAPSCGGTPPTQPPPVLTLQCPTRVDAEATSAGGAAVSYNVSLLGGRPPVSVSCTPASGTLFAPGLTTVSCSAADAGSQSAGCLFTVVVRRTPTIAWTRFLAFGDSITEGKTSPFAGLLIPVEFPGAYPGQLQQMLADRYTSQTFTVLNYGVGGERARRGRDRLPGVLDQERPEVLLLLEGVNNIRNESTEQVAGYLDEMVREARERNIEVLIATLLPISNELEARDSWTGTQEAIRELNEDIQGIAGKNNLGPAVDLYTVFLQTPSLLSADGLHPTVEGYTRIAEVFFNAIRARFEITGQAGVAWPSRH